MTTTRKYPYPPGRTTKAGRRAAKARQLALRRAVRAHAAAAGASPAAAAAGAVLLREPHRRRGTGHMMRNADNMPVTVRSPQRPGAARYVMRDISVNSVVRVLALWGPGPWQHEPDWQTWTTRAGLPGLVLRHGEVGHLCGYVGVPPGHRLHGASTEVAMDTMDDMECSELTYGGRAYPAMAVPQRDWWWFGFDNGHAGEYTPGVRRLVEYLNEGAPRDYDHAAALAEPDWTKREVYRLVTYTRWGAESLATALAEAEQRQDAEPAPDGHIPGTA